MRKQKWFWISRFKTCELNGHPLWVHAANVNNYGTKKINDTTSKQWPRNAEQSATIAFVLLDVFGIAHFCSE